LAILAFFHCAASPLVARPYLVAAPRRADRSHTPRVNTVISVAILVSPMDRANGLWC
jgi:hypothetical protein